MFAFTRLSLARQYLLASFLILFCGMVIVGAWVGRQIEIGVTNRIAAVTALYVDSLVSHHLLYLVDTDVTNDSHEAEIDALLGTTPLGQRIVALRVWGPDGRILYSTSPDLVGLRFPIEGGLKAALNGDVHTEISDLNRDENIYEKEGGSRLIETYAPVRLGGESKVVAVIEFYQTLDELRVEIRAAQQRSWVMVGVSTIMIYLLLAGLVGRASNTIAAQRNELQEKVAQLTELLAQNEKLHRRVSRAAVRTTTLNERFLGRISADLHDGPGQDLALALLRIDEVAEVCAVCKVALAKRGAVNDDLGTIQSALRSALADMRAILAGLRLPEIGQLSTTETAERAVRDFERKTGTQVALAMSGLPAAAPLPVKITLYRTIQESLANGFRHAKADSQHVSIARQGSQLIAEISDDGVGFDHQNTFSQESLGLVGMRERVEILGGTFEINSTTGIGTVIRARLPLDLQEDQSE